ncbi:hypothetical protein MMC12_003603 [Toensbergia leucococca]|nr:hypothetical protein [Toensbergia leucococca]
MFDDLPSIDLDEREPMWKGRTSGEDFELLWHPSNTHRMSSGMPNASGMNVFPQDPAYQTMSNLQRFLHDPEHPCITSGLSSWDTRYLKSNEDPYASGLHKPFEPSNPWPSTLGVPREASPEGFWGGERPANEQDSCSGSSSWSPRTSDSYFEMKLGYPQSCIVSQSYYPAWNGAQGYDSDPLHSDYSPCLSGGSSYSSPRHGTSVALRDVQQYPDTDVEQSPSQPELQRLHMEHTRFSECPGPIQCRGEPVNFIDRHDHVNNTPVHDYPIASPTMEEDVSIEENPKMDVDSDYSPSTGAKRSNRRRTSKSGSSSKSPTSPTKSSSRTSTRVTKSTKPPKTPSKPGPSNQSLTPPKTSAQNSTPTCSYCALTFATSSALDKHVKAKHIRPFTCSFHLYGCPATFGSKNEWKRHVSSQHLRLAIYRCDIGACVPQQHRRKSSSSSFPKKASTSLAHTGDACVGASYNDFNRKDLFIQHVRRMHGPHPSASKADKDAFDVDLLDSVRARCWMQLREAPPRSICSYCNSRSDIIAGGGKKEVVFEGAGAWDERMEHVSRHLEKGEREVGEDVGLREWMLGEGLVEWDGEGSIRLVGGGGARKRGGDEDAEGVDE